MEKKIMTTIISIVLLIVLVSASTYAVVVNVKENNEVLEIVNEVNIIDLVTDNDGVYNNTYYNVRNELDITDSEASIIIQSDSLNEALHLVLQSLVDYKINKNNSARLSNQELYNLILEYTNKDEAMPSYLKDKIIDKSNIYITDVNDFLKKMIHLRKRGLKTLLAAKEVFFLSEAYRRQVFEKYVPQKYQEVIKKKTHI